MNNIISFQEQILAGDLTQFNQDLLGILKDLKSLADYQQDFGHFSLLILQFQDFSRKIVKIWFVRLFLDLS